MKFSGKYTPTRIFKLTFSMGILAFVYYFIVMMAVVGDVHWLYIIGLPLFAAYCLHYESSSNRIILLDDSIAISVAGGGLIKSRKNRLVYLPYEDIDELKEHKNMIMLKMSREIVVKKASLFSKQMTATTFLLRPSNKDGLFAELKSRV